MPTLRCGYCNRPFEPDAETRFLTINIGGHLRISPSWGTLDRFQRSGLVREWENASEAVAACGQNHTLILTERFIDRATFEPLLVAQLEAQLAQTA